MPPRLREAKPSASFSEFPTSEAALTAVLAALACVTAVPVFLRYKTFFLKEPVGPSWASIPFPAVVFADAMGRLALLCPSGRVVLTPLAWLLFANAVAVVAAVWVGYVRLLRAGGALSFEYLPPAFVPYEAEEAREWAPCAVTIDDDDDTTRASVELADAAAEDDATTPM